MTDPLLISELPTVTADEAKALEGQEPCDECRDDPDVTTCESCGFRRVLVVDD